MASLKDEVLAKLAAVPTPDGAPLTQSGKLSDILVTDGKVFCSITVDAAKVKAWESVRARAEEGSRARSTRRALSDDCFDRRTRRGRWRTGASAAAIVCSPAAPGRRG